MTEPAGRVLEGVFAVRKPPSLSSAQVLRDLQHAFGKSRTFQPLLVETRAKEQQNQKRSKRRRIDDDNVFKMGHGGTLDPMATGVLIVGIGRGTKSLQDFLYCTKTYDTVVLFGKSTDTYDVAGKVVASAETSHITRELVEKNLDAFRGKIKQVPPIYSALKIDGMKAYDYARSGKELPRELEARNMEVSECVLTKWYDVSKHEYRWPATEASEEEKKVYTKLDAKAMPAGAQPESSESSRTEREGSFVSAPETQETSKPDAASRISPKPMSKEEKTALHTHELTGLCEEVADAPAARIKLTVSSGFYVRSFAHDLGKACGSYGTMAELARTRQADYTTADPVPENFIPTLDHADIAKGEDVWGPKVKNVLEAWLEKNPAPTDNSLRRRDDRSFSGKHSKHDGREDRRAGNHKRRNSSSPEA